MKGFTTIYFQHETVATQSLRRIAANLRSHDKAPRVIAH